MFKNTQTTPGQGRVLQGITFLVICPPLLTILNFSPPPHVLEHSDQPVSGAEEKNQKGKCFSLYSKMPVYLLICCSPDLVCQYLYITSSHWDIFHCLVLLWFQRMSIPLSKGVKLPLPPQFLPTTTTTLEMLVKSSFMLSFKILAFKTSLTLSISNGVATESKIWNWAITNRYIQYIHT